MLSEDKLPLVSIVVPCFNEEQAIPIFYKTLKADFAKDKFPANLELIFVNDGSSDQTLNVIKALHSEHPNEVHYVSLSRHFGKEPGLMAGLKEAHGDYIAIMDVDLQDPPELLPKMLNILEDPKQNFDLVVTRRDSRNHEGKIRSFFSHAFYKFINSISEIKLLPDERDYRLMKRKVVNAFLSLPECDRFSRGLFAWIGFNRTYIAFPDHERSVGKSKFSIKSLYRLAMNSVFSFSQIALNIASWLGFMFCLLAFIAIIWLIVRKCIDPTIALRGWTSLASLILLVAGVQLFCIGMIGKYLGKVFDQTKHRPNYIISEKK